ncbi:MAG TPA: AzlC family ABC transporter permease [Gaiellaceae bacterium]|jgi:4-azaleucine resistance transporter AzlC|nr:AzlC family ABC transporter permease [Gaiellaceae bacterium]
MRAGARTIAPLLPAVVAFGVSYGVLARASGMGALAPVVMSATTFAGSAQFAAASILGDAGTVAAAVVAAVLLNARYAPMSVAVGRGFHGPLWRRFLVSQLIVDESWALSARGEGRFDVPFLLGAGLTLYPVWVSGTAIGVAAGDLVGDPERLGLDAAFPALFLALLAGQIQTGPARMAALLGGAIAAVLVPIAPAGIPIVAAVAACLIGARR